MQPSQSKLDKYFLAKNIARPNNNLLLNKKDNLSQHLSMNNRNANVSERHQNGYQKHLINKHQSLKKIEKPLKEAKKESNNDTDISNEEVEITMSNSFQNNFLKPLIKNQNKKTKPENSKIISDKGPRVELEDSRSNLEKSKILVVQQMILIGPFDCVDGDKGQKKLTELMQNCSKQTIIQWIRNRNERSKYPTNYRLIEKIEDEQFWCEYMSRIIGLILQGADEINSCIEMLSQKYKTQDVILSRKQIFLLIGCMFLSILPPQMNNELVSFAYLMTINDKDNRNMDKSKIRLQKLKCIINYLKFMVENPEIHEDLVMYRRVYDVNRAYLAKNHQNTPLKKVTCSTSRIEDGVGQGIIIDFANSSVGGGFLTNGCAQQEIMFSIFPQMILTKLLCWSLESEQGIVVQNAMRINDYQGYSDEFKFVGTSKKIHEESNRKCIAAIDAIDFSKGILKSTKEMQYGSKLIKRQIHKMCLTIKSATQINSNLKQVFTGRWGCGVFGGDEILKFCIQWIACSFAKLQMQFMTSQNMLMQMRLLYENVCRLSAEQLLSLLQQFGKDTYFMNNGGLLAFLKQYV